LIAQTFPDNTDHVRKIVWCESRFNPNAYNLNPETGDESVGLAQINILGYLYDGRLTQARALGFTGSDKAELIEWLKIPKNNIAMMAEISKNGFGAWSCDRKVKDTGWKYYQKMIESLVKKYV
jgi:hypothetical protein